MKLSQLLETPGSKKLVVIYGGRFQPFHKGHYHAYRWLCKHFGRKNVWIATSDKTNFDPAEGDISPYNFEEKKEIMTTLFPIPPSRIIKCKNPAFKPVEVWKLYDKFKVVYLAAVGAKNEDRYDGDFFSPLPEDVELPRDVDQLSSLDEKKGYYVPVPMGNKGISGTRVRQLLVDCVTDAHKRAVFKECFGDYDSVLAGMMIGKLKDVKHDEENPDEAS